MKIQSPHKNRKTLLMTASIAALLSSTASAQEPNAENEMSALETIVVTATRNESSVAKAPASISVVNPETIKRQPIKDLVDVLKALPGISNHVTQGGRNGVVIRGLDEDYVLRLVDGKRISSSTGIWRRNNFDNTPVPLALIDQVEVIRGPMSALYGADAVGGVINIITREPEDEWMSVIDVEQGFMGQGRDGNRSRLSFLSLGKINETLGLTVSAERTKQDAWFYDPVGLVAGRTSDYNVIEPREGLRLTGALDWDIANNQTVGIDIAYDQDEVLFSNFDRYQRSQLIERVSYSLKHEGDWGWGSTELLFSQSNADMKDYNSRYIDDPATQRDEQYLEPTEIYTTLRAVSYLELGNHAVTVGLEYLKTKIEDDIQYPVNGSDSLSLGSIFLQDEISIGDNLTVTLGIRADDAEVYGMHVSPRAYLVYDLADGITLKGGVGSAFRAPTLFEASPNFQSISCGGRCFIFGNPDLNEETSISSELSLLVDRERWNASFTLYNNEVKDLIEVGRYAPGTPRAGNVAYFNIENATLRGVELQFQIDLTETFNVDANYTYLDASGPDGLPLAYRPKHKANIQVNFDITDALSTYVGANYYGDYIDYRRRDATPYVQDAYTLIDLGARYQLSEKIAFRGGMTNVTGVHPIVDNPDSDLHLQGRAIFLGAEITF